MYHHHQTHSLHAQHILTPNKSANKTINQKHHKAFARLRRRVQITRGLHGSMNGADFKAEKVYGATKQEESDQQQTDVGHVDSTVILERNRQC